MAYIVGQLVRLASYGGTIAAPTLGFRDSSGTLVDPATVTLKYKTPAGTITTVNGPPYGGVGEIVKDATGLYHLDVDTTGTATGNWWYEWSAPNQTIAANMFVVVPAPI